MNENIYLKVVEENVDGCGSDVEMYVKFNKPIESEAITAFASILADTKREMIAEDDCDTSEDFVVAALEVFNNTLQAQARGLKGEMACDPFVATVTF